MPFIEVTKNMKGIRPVTVESRKTRAIWNILHNKGFKSNLVGWWPSFPAEPINGVVVSDKFQKVNLNPKEKGSSGQIDRFMANYISKLKWGWQA